MRWIALNDLLQDGDYVDEIYFYNHYPPGVDEDTPGARRRRRRRRTLFVRGFHVSVPSLSWQTK
jgi:hypothetical protein